MTNRAPPPITMQTRFGFIPRPTAPGLHQIRTSTIASRSRSISPTSTISANSSSSSPLVSQRLTKASKTTTNQSIPPSITTNPSLPPSSTTTNNTSKPKTLTSPRQRDTSISKSNVKSTLQSPTASSQMRSRTPSRTSSTASPLSYVASPSHSSAPLSSSNTAAALKTDVNTIRDRYKTQKRMNFFTHHTPISTANGSPIASSIKSPESLMINKEKKQSSPKPSSTNNPVKNKIKRKLSFKKIIFSFLIEL